MSDTINTILGLASGDFLGGLVSAVIVVFGVCVAVSVVFSTISNIFK